MFWPRPLTHGRWGYRLHINWSQKGNMIMWGMASLHPLGGITHIFHEGIRDDGKWLFIC